MIEYKTPIQFIKNVGLQRANALKKLNLHTVIDLIYFFPQSYLNYGKIVAIDKLLPNRIQSITGKISRIEEKKIRQRLSMFTIFVTDKSGLLKIVFFNQKFLKKIFKVGDHWIFRGKVENKFGLQLTQVTYEKWTDNASTSLTKILPIYGLTEGIYQNTMRQIINNTLKELCTHKILENLPAYLLKERNLMPRSLSFQMIHRPSSEDLLKKARYRLVYEEFFFLQYALLKKKKELKQKERKSICFKNQDQFLKNFEKKIPFSLTKSQKKVMKEIEKDLKSKKVMLRLLQGDVGSGKTIVSIYAMALMVQSGYQVAFMAPTAILAIQHFEQLNSFFNLFEMHSEILLGSTSSKKKTQILGALASNHLDVLVGTHALIEPHVVFHNLGLIIIDEQHKFGVAQRASLQKKGTHPHLLVVSATPIPRTFSLVLYGDLDISMIDELPKNRKKIKTHFVDESQRENLYNFLKKNIEKNRQIYFVYPLIEKSEYIKGKSLEDFFDILHDVVFKNYRVAILHGRMKIEKKKEIIDAFRCQEINILLSTTVIEVGLDVPNATIMVIESPSRFGLAQLHQLRGRVGRGTEQSYCFLIEDNLSPSCRKRIDIFCSTHNGFDIAKSDLAIRGPGDFLGVKQSGIEQLRLGNIVKDFELMKSVRSDLIILFNKKEYILNDKNNNIFKQNKISFANTF